MGPVVGADGRSLAPNRMAEWSATNRYGAPFLGKHKLFRSGRLERFECRRSEFGHLRSHSEDWLSPNEIT
jgi:hypothetical protein